MMRSPLVVILSTLYLAIRYVQSGSIPGHLEPSKYVEKGELAQMQYIIMHVEETLKGQQELIGSLQTDLLETRNLLAQALLKLASPTDLDMKSSGNHDITKRSAPEQPSADYDDILSDHSLQRLLPLITAICKDGRDGKDGDDGKDGIDGEQGRDGKDGDDGKDGKDGRDGLPGADGSDGSPGPQGVAGSPGTTGPTGQPGARGPVGLPGNFTRGQPGQDGQKGQTGEQGAKGVSGSQGPRGSPGDAAQTHSVYTRWGRTICTSGTTLIYQGFAAGTYFNITGGGVNFQCMPLEPEYNSMTGNYSSILSGVEYQTSNVGLFPRPVHDQNVPCARCLTPRSAVMMYPAMRNCPAGWNKEYEGYLMSGSIGHTHPTTFECVDSSPEHIRGHGSNTDGALLYFITPDCSGSGTIGDCTYYNTGKQLTCVVCSK